LLVEQLYEKDRIAIVVYAGAAGLVLPPTAGDNKATILQAIDMLEAGGSTAGGQGIELAYQMAKENFIEGGNNRVILATDGDFNVGPSSDAELVRLIEQKRDEGIFLTILGFGTGNYKDSKMEQLADKGNGNYAYLDNIREAKKVLVSELAGTLLTIAKDVKIQVEFNPAKVKAYRLIGYENRMLAKEDFADDTKDAGELGAGHAVTALYELIPVDADEATRPTPELKYQETDLSAEAEQTNELMTVKLRYKQPDEDESILMVQPVLDESISLEQSSDNFKFSAAVAEFGLLLRDSQFKGDATYAQVLELAKGAKGQDEAGYRAEFIRLVETVELLK
jgi:Ca-activated chloride channel family protein